MDDGAFASAFIWKWPLPVTILSLPPAECERLAGWMSDLMRTARRVAQSAAAHAGAKRIAHREIAALDEYVIVAQDTIEVTAFRREEDCKPLTLHSADAALHLRSIDLSIPLTWIYEGELL